MPNADAASPRPTLPRDPAAATADKLVVVDRRADLAAAAVADPRADQLKASARRESAIAQSAPSRGAADVAGAFVRVQHEQSGRSGLQPEMWRSAGTAARRTRVGAALVHAARQL